MTKEADDAITRGTGSVFADLGYADAEERQTKPRLVHAITGLIARLSQAAAGEDDRGDPIGDVSGFQRRAAQL